MSAHMPLHKVNGLISVVLIYTQYDAIHRSVEGTDKDHTNKVGAAGKKTNMTTIGTNGKARKHMLHSPCVYNIIFILG